MFSLGKTTGPRDSDNSRKFEVGCWAPAAGDSESRRREKALRGISRAQRCATLVLSFVPRSARRGNKLEAGAGFGTRARVGKMA